MALTHLARQALNLKPGMAIAKGGSYALRIARAYARQAFSLGRSTFVDIKADGGDRAGWLSHDYSGLDAHLTPPLSDNIHEDAAAVSAHSFDLLGSSPIRVAYGMRAPGFEGRRYPVELKPTNVEQIVNRLSSGNRRRALAIRNLIDDTYNPIDWQIDFKSGFRWSENTVSGALRYGHEPGVDVKVPWELARMQHLPGLALAFRLDRQAGLEREFRNQALDFAAANPPGYGVNWMCTMDVAIRAANLVLAMDMFIASGAEFDAPFLAEFRALIEAHGKHVSGNLEWHDLHRGNHYLANIAGLLFIAAYLPPAPKTNDWLIFATRQLIAEVERQFTEDGANFEASTSYHRLSMEMVVYATALVQGLDEDRIQVLKAAEINMPLFPPWYLERLERMAEFSMHITKPNGRIVQIGDNDSGRFISICPLGGDTSLDHGSTIGAASALFKRADFSEFSGAEDQASAALVSALAKGRRVESYLDEGEPPHAVNRPSGTPASVNDDKNIISDTMIELPDRSVLDDLEMLSYADFGLYIWRSPRFFLSVRCGPIGQNGNGGHAHNDQLAIELNIDGEDWLADPGTYVYTPSPKRRDSYRSVRAHAAPGIDGQEPAALTLGMFRLEDKAKAKCTYFSATEFEGSHVGYGFPLRRRIFIEGGAIRIVDDTHGAGGDLTAATHPVIIRDARALKVHFSLNIAFSPGYGLFE